MRERVLELARGALAAVEANRRRIDNLNVYPVPDGDTGTNLALTMRAVVEALEATTTDERRALAREVTRSALMGARGNSGVILSQIIRGACDVLGQRDDLPEALRAAAGAAYRAVKTPVEGTMLTAVREMAEAATTGADIQQIVARGDDCVRRTTEMLPVLKAAGVVDAGAAGLVEIARGVAAVVAGEPLPEASVDDGFSPDAVHQELSRFRYCTVFVVEGEELDAAALETELERLGDSLLVVGDPTALKIHVHTDDPGRALSLGVARGAIGGVEIANMHQQTLEREERLLHAVPELSDRTCEAVAVVAGKGNARLFESLGARSVDGGRTMNPSTADILAAVESAATADVVVLPNNKNVILSAEQAAAHSSKAVRVLATESIQAGLAAMVAFDPNRHAADNATEMGAALAAVATGAVTLASRDLDSQGGVVIRKGAWLGLAEGEPVVGGESFDEVARAVVERMLSEPRGILTLLTGEEPPALDDLINEIEKGHPGLELEVHDGGQPHYPLLLVAE